MNVEQCEQYLLSKPEAFIDYPFGAEAQVFKIQGKMFALIFTQKDGQSSINLKCDPFEAVQLRDVFSAIKPGYHMNKTHWNTIVLDGTVPIAEMQRMIDNSYSLVVKTLKKATRLGLEMRYGQENIYR